MDGSGNEYLVWLRQAGCGNDVLQKPSPRAQRDPEAGDLAKRPLISAVGQERSSKRLEPGSIPGARYAAAQETPSKTGSPPRVTSAFAALLFRRCNFFPALERLSEVRRVRVPQAEEGNFLDRKLAALEITHSQHMANLLQNGLE